MRLRKEQYRLSLGESLLGIVFHLRMIAVVLALALMWVLFPGTAPAQGTPINMPLPDGFQADLVAEGLDYPSTFDILPNGDILIGENSGLVRLYRDGQLQSTPFIDLRPIVNDWWDRGLISLRAAPDFEQSGHAYFYFTYEHDPSNFTGPKTARLIRVNSNGTTATLSGHQVIVGSAVGDSCNPLPEDADCIPTNAPGHSAGDIQFAPDGNIFLTVGDGADWNIAHPDALRSQNLNVLGGKVLRITPDGQGLPDNPFWNGDPNSNRSKIWASGLRNAYRMELHPGTGVPFVGDVGWSSWEEINVATAGANLGWPCYEGSGQQSSYSSFQQCQDLYNQGASAVTPPLVEYSHAGGGAAITAGVFYTHEAFPDQYQGAFFYGDYSRGFINYIHVDENLNLTGLPQSFTPAAGSPVNFELGSDGSLYYLSIHEGELRRITFTGAPPDGPPNGDVVYLSDLEWVSATNGWGPVERDHSNGELDSHGGPIVIDGTIYGKGLGVHAFSEIVFDLDGSCHSFASDIGMPDYYASLGSVTFSVLVDGEEAFASGTFIGSSPAQSIEVDISGASELRLLVGDAGDGVDYDHANWADARLLCDEDDEPPPDPPVEPPPGDEIVYLSDLEWVSATNGWGPVERDHSNGEQDSHGGPITIDGTTYEKGLGVHAFSEIVFELDGSCTAFRSDIGLPDYLGSNGSVTFEVVVDGNSEYLSSVMTGVSPVQSVDVDIVGATELRLLVGDGGNGINYDHANWADARLLCESESKPPVDPPSVTITSPSPSDLFTVGDTVDFAGEAFDYEGEPIPASGLSWRVRIHHCSAIDCHIHQMLNPSGVDSGSFPVPDHGDIFYFEFILTAEDDNGLTSTDVLELHPVTVDVTIATEPGGLDAALGGVSGPSPLTRTLVANSENTIFVPSPQQGYEFVEWQHGGARNQNVTVEDEDVTFTAIFEEIDPPDDPPDDPPPGQEVVYLSDLEWVSATNGWGPVERDHSNGELDSHGGPIVIDGTIYGKGLGVHAFSEIVFDLDGSCHNFASDIGMPDYYASLGSVTFSVLVDGEQAFASGTFIGSSPAQSIEVDISGASELRLLVGDAGDGVDYDHANWADARLLCDEDDEPPADPPADPPVATITSPSGDEPFKVGDAIEFSGEATDHNGQPIPASGLTWDMRILHCVGGDCHDHELFNESGLSSGSFTVPDHGDVFSIEIALTAEDENGLTDTATLDLLPLTIDATVATSPTGLQVELGEESGASPLTRTLVANSEITIFAPSTQQDHEFVEWQHGGPQSQSVSVPEQDVTYTAVFEEIEPPDDPPDDPPPGQQVDYLSDLEWVSATNGWGPVERDHNNGEQTSHGGPITIDGNVYEKGLGVHAFSEIVFSLDGSCHTFASDIGMPDYYGSLGSVTFSVLVDGAEVYASDLFIGSSPAESIEVDIAGASELRLFVGDAGDGVDYDHANWADARLLCGEDTASGSHQFAALLAFGALSGVVVGVRTRPQ